MEGTLEGAGFGDRDEAETCSLPPNPRPRYEVHLSVRDTGIGIPSNRIDRLFQSFSQVDTSMSRKYGGTGLGLVISKRLAEMMGGTMWAESEEGKGSVFHSTFVAGAAPPQPRPYLDPDQPALQGKRVLVVDDNETNRFVLTRHLSRWGMETRTTESATEALEWIRWGIPFDIAILDMHMPEMDGLELAEHIRVERDACTLPLVLWTSILGRSDIERTSSVEIAATLTKPVRPATLYDMLVGFFEGKPREMILPTVWGEIDRHMGQHHPLRILLAEDNTVNQKVALRLLEKLGYHADVASNGLEVLHALERRSYDVVLMDIQMPEMDGIEATRAIRARWDQSRQPRIVAMTAHAMEGMRESLIEAGMDDYVRKPIKLEELVAALKHVEPSLLLAPSVAARSSISPSAQVGEPAEPGKPVQPAKLTAEPVDFAVLEQLKTVMGRVQVFYELVNLYLEDTPELLSSLRQALEAGDIQVLVRSSHSLKSSSAQIGAMRLSRLSERLEALGRAGALEGAAPLIRMATDEFEQVRKVLMGRFWE
ncbi:MAG: response regulator [Chloroflexaceae bacterium]|nr:response regulator [Chloroflexaceae bacterium]